MRIDKFLSNMTEGSRSEIKKLIKSKLVSVNSTIIDNPSFQVSETSEVYIGNRKIEYIRFKYIMMNKPQGVISATEDKKYKTVVDLLDHKLKLINLAPVGRLDKDTEGFILLTNDGELNHNILSPKKHVSKTYYAKIDGIVTESDIELFKSGLKLDDGYITMPALLKIIKSNEISEIELTIMEGKFHQVKRMFETVNKKVIYLKRIAIGSLKLDEGLKLGEYRDLTQAELNLLKNKE